MFKKVRKKLRDGWTNLRMRVRKLFGLNTRCGYTLVFDNAANDAAIPLEVIARNPSVYFMAIESGVLQVRITLPGGEERTGKEAWSYIRASVHPPLFFVVAEYDTVFRTGDDTVYQAADLVESEEVEEIEITGTFPTNNA